MGLELGIVSLAPVGARSHCENSVHVQYLYFFNVIIVSLELNLGVLAHGVFVGITYGLKACAVASCLRALGIAQIRMSHRLPSGQSRGC